MSYDFLAAQEYVLFKLTAFAPLISESFAAASQIYFELEKDENILASVACSSSDAAEKNLKKIGKNNLIDSAKKIKIPWQEIEPFLKSKKPNLEKEIRVHLSKFKELTKKIFGFELPQKTTIMLSKCFGPEYIWGSTVTDFPIVSLYVGENRSMADHAAIVFHEIIHSLIKSSGMRTTKGKKICDEEEFEEALIGFFLPRGLIAKELGLNGSTNIDEIMQKMHRRSWMKGWDEKLAPAMKEYFEIWKTQTVWDFLRQKKLYP